MSKITKKQLQRAIQRQESRIDGLVGLLAKKGYYDKESEPQLKQLDQSVFNGLDNKWKFAAIDKNGEANLYTRRMTPDGVEFIYYEGFDLDCEKIGTGYDASNWQNSLIERDTAKELTGSELCKAMLKNQVYVPCFVSDVSEAHAIERKQTAMIDKVYSGLPFIFRSGYNGWTYVVPINNQGEPLTASEVGL